MRNIRSSFLFVCVCVCVCGGGGGGGDLAYGLYNRAEKCSNHLMSHTKICFTKTQ